MKRFILFALALPALFLVFTPQTVQASAEEPVYAVAETADVWFYADKDENSKLFCIPRTYYVKVIAKEGDYTEAEYLRDSAPYRKIHGYCKTDSLTFVDFVPERPYLYREITAEYVLPGASLGNGSFAGLECTFVYYGTRYDAGQLYFYVCRDNVFDYIPADEEITFETNTDYLPVVKEEAKGGLSVAEIVVICLVSAAVIVIAVFVVRGRKAAPSADL